MNRFMRYAGAFATGFMAPLIGIMATGNWPSVHILPAALAAGMMGTGLFHMTPPAKPTPPAQ